MNYKLAKQLKDAGFPQKANKNSGIYLDRNTVVKPIMKPSDLMPKEYTVIPILEELIDACGDEFFKLINLNGEEGWHAEAHNFKGGKIGKTKKEAVAKLWLKLNKK